MFLRRFPVFTVFKTPATVCGLDGDVSELGAGQGAGVDTIWVASWWCGVRAVETPAVSWRENRKDQMAAWRALGSARHLLGCLGPDWLLWGLYFPKTPTHPACFSFLFQVPETHLLPGVFSSQVLCGATSPWQHPSLLPRKTGIQTFAIF